jgi:hypothetical protein
MTAFVLSMERLELDEVPTGTELYGVDHIIFERTLLPPFGEYELFPDVENVETRIVDPMQIPPRWREAVDLENISITLRWRHPIPAGINNSDGDIQSQLV